VEIIKSLSEAGKSSGVFTLKWQEIWADFNNSSFYYFDDMTIKEDDRLAVRK